MNELKKISSAFEDTLKDTDLHSMTIDLAETFSDTFLHDGLLKDIPIIGTIVNLSKVAMNLKDRLLIKKLIYFLSELKEIDTEKRERLISQIDNSDKEKIKVGEKLLYIVDACDDHISARYIAVLFKAFLNEKISYSEFIRCSSIIRRLIIEDLEKYIDTEIEELECIEDPNDYTVSDFQFSLINAGICATGTEQISISDQDDYKRASISDRYVVSGGEFVIYLTPIGHKLKTILTEKIKR